MAVTYPFTHDGMFKGLLSIEAVSYILDIRRRKCIPNLINGIYDFNAELITESLTSQESIRDILDRRGEDINKYLGEMRDYQTVGTAFMYMSPKSIIADGVGAGKTIEIAGLINFLHKRKEITRFLMAVDESAIGQTQGELIRFTGLNVVQLPPEAAKMRKFLEKTNWSKVDGILIKHSTLRSDALLNWVALNITADGKRNKIFNTFILDESSVIRNRDSKTYDYTEKLFGLATRAHEMNATVFETHIMDIYNQLDAMCPELLPSKTAIQKKYCTFERDHFWKTVKGRRQQQFVYNLKGYKNQQEFREALSLVYFGRTKDELGLRKEHQYLVREVMPTTEQTLEINKGRRYMEVLNSPETIPEMGIANTRKNVPKLDKLVSLVENELSGQSIVIYCFHVEAQKAIKRELELLGRKVVILAGKKKDEDTPEAYKLQQEFNSGVYDVMVTNKKRSLNLSGADVLIFYTVETVPAKIEQIGGRIDRNVDDKIKTFILMVYKCSPEYKFLEDVVYQRSKDSKALTIDAKTTIDFFMEAMEKEE